jgi:hypothetical protein
MMDPEEKTPGNSTIRYPAVHIRVYTLIDEIKPGRFPQKNRGQVYTLDRLSALGYDRIIGNHYEPWHSGKYRGKKPEDERQRANLPESFHGISFSFFV